MGKHKIRQHFTEGEREVDEGRVEKGVGGWEGEQVRENRRVFVLVCGESKLLGGGDRVVWIFYGEPKYRIVYVCVFDVEYPDGRSSPQEQVE